MTNPDPGPCGIDLTVKEDGPTLEQLHFEEVKRSNAFEAECERLRAQLAAAEASEDQWMDAATYEIGGVPHYWSDRAKAAETKLASARKALEELNKSLATDAYRLTQCLDRSDWTPRRAHTEGDRNSIQSAADRITQIIRALSDTGEKVLP